jgi:hypothetical protein
MAGFSKAYVLGPRNYDGVNPIELMLLVGDADRQWFEPLYVAAGLHSLGALKTLIPAGPDDPDALLDACLAFHPSAFAACPSLAQVEAALGRETRLAIGHAPPAVAAPWKTLREEARPIFAKLSISEARFVPRKPVPSGVVSDDVGAEDAADA